MNFTDLLIIKRDENSVGDFQGEDFPEFEDEIIALTFSGH